MIDTAKDKAAGKHIPDPPAPDAQKVAKAEAAPAAEALVVEDTAPAEAAAEPEPVESDPNIVWGERSTPAGIVYSVSKGGPGGVITREMTVALGADAKDVTKAKASLEAWATR